MDKQSTGVAHSPFQTLQFRVADVHWRWKNWKQLFMGDPAHREEADEMFALMNSVAPQFFVLIREVLLQDVALRLCKLIDPAEGGPTKARRRNFSLHAALKDAEARPDFPNSSRVQMLVGEMKTTAEPLIQWRNWVFAHDDYEVATGAHEPSRLNDTHIEAALKTAIDVMDLLDPECDKTGYGYTMMLAIGDASHLILALRNAEAYRREQLDRYRR